LADTDIDALPAVLHRWATLGTDGFLLSTPAVVARARSVPVPPS
jgi:phosphohistidine swiveling domain-containing protein